MKNTEKRKTKTREVYAMKNPMAICDVGLTKNAEIVGRCDVCGKTSSSKDGLRTIYVRQDKYNFICKECQDVFNDELMKYMKGGEE